MPQSTDQHPKRDTLISYMGWIMLIFAIGLALASQWYFWGFVQDDAYISLRYSRNLVEGLGLVFNPGEYVEGYSNFLWTMLGAAYIAVGFNPILSLSVTGCVSAIFLLVMLYFLTRTVRGTSRPIWDAVPVFLLGASSTLGLWSVSGLEQVFFTLSGWGGILFLLRGRPRWACGFLLLAMLTRPEGVLFFLLAAYLALHPARFQIIPNRFAFLTPAIIVFGIFLIYCGWRFWYFGDLLPNTFYVKGGGGITNIKHGLASFKRLCIFNLNGVLLFLAPFALLPAKRRALSLALLLFLIGYCLYEIKIGGDFLPMFRLHLTVLPVQCLLAARAMEGVSVLAMKIVKQEYLPICNKVTPLFVTAIIGALCINMLYYTLRHPEFGNLSDSLEKCHGDIGRYLQRNAKSGDVVLAQDMGAIPWYARDLIFIDTIGLVDKTIAKAQYNANYTPYIRYLLWPDKDARTRIIQMEDRMRAYIFSRTPRYAVVNVHYDADRYSDVMKAMENRNKFFFRSAVRRNVFFYSLDKADEWAEYRLIKGWPYSNQHHLLLFERE